MVEAAATAPFTLSSRANTTATDMIVLTDLHAAHNCSISADHYVFLSF